MSFLRHAGIYRSDDASVAGSEPLCSLPALIGLDEFQPAIPWQVALQQSLPPLRRLPTILNNLTRRTMTFQRTVTTPLIRCLSPRVQSRCSHPRHARRRRPDRSLCRRWPSFSEAAEKRHDEVLSRLPAWHANYKCRADQCRLAQVCSSIPDRSRTGRVKPKL
jgi:hypothetical protein